jgi:hypothetical protein
MIGEKMKAKLPLMVQDPRTAKNKGPKKLIEGFHPEFESFFLDGPVTRRVAVIDFSPETGKLAQSARFEPPAPRKRLGHYMNHSGKKLIKASGDEIYSPEFIQTSVFATVLRTMYLFERTEALGRKLAWAFDAPQLLVVPRAGEWANAFYHRDSHSLQFFYFKSPKDGQTTIYTGLSRDIVAHETGHAILDGIAPDLLNACTPQSLSIHEAIADLTAVLMAFCSRNLTLKVLEDNKGSIRDSSDFSCIAEQVGDALREEGRGLRNLHNDKTLNPEGGENFVNETEPHALSEVLSGALYSVMENIHDDLKAQYAPEYSEYPDPLFSASGKALAVGAERFKRMIFRAVDYMAPGEVSFTDYGRAIIAVDQVAYPDDDKMRNWIMKEFLKRHIIKEKVELEFNKNFPVDKIEDTETATLASSDWAAYDFVNKNRELFCIPSTEEPVPFQVRPRFMVSKKHAKKDPEEPDLYRECLFKVSWNHEEENDLGSRYPKKRSITVGTTLVIEWETGRILARLTSAPPTEYIMKCQSLQKKQRELATLAYEHQKSVRNMFLKSLVKKGLLKVGDQAIRPGGKAAMSYIQAQVTGGVMHVQGTANMLHLMGNIGEE